jgi:hypothetical protein
MFYEIEGGSEVWRANHSGPLRFLQPCLDRPASFQGPAATRDILFGDVTGAIHLRHFPKHGYKSQKILRFFNVLQIPNLVGDEGVALGGVIQCDLVVKLEPSPIRRPLFL